jgi:hydroxypyruvate isomerase
MPRFAANVSMVFTEVHFVQRFQRAAASGFTEVECLFDWAEHSPALLRNELDRWGLSLVLFNLLPGDLDKGDRGIAAIPGREEEFEAAAGVGRARVGVCQRVQFLNTTARRNVCDEHQVCCWVFFKDWYNCLP